MLKSSTIMKWSNGNTMGLWYTMVLSRCMSKKEFNTSVSTSSFSGHTFCAGSMPNCDAYSLLKTTTAPNVFTGLVSDCCVSILILHHDPLSSRCYSSQSASQPPPQPGPGSAPRAARQHQMSPELTGTARRAHHDTSSRSPRQRPQRWTFTCHRHHTPSCILRGLSTLRWLCWRTDAGTNTQNLNWV